jgi:hypothetical protein
MADPKLSLDPSDREDVEIEDQDNPEWTEEDFAKALPLREALPDLYAQIVAEWDWRERMADALTEAARKKHAA